uniref:GAF domain-containing protein n=1 Tax=Tanacetum cinerariifolium TaxID=118510 RepID=A0A699GRN8_TANCI|nr:GAF domain-containing protein [Tanacetum cinerariifolium]
MRGTLRLKDDRPRMVITFNNKSTIWASSDGHQGGKMVRSSASPLNIHLTSTLSQLFHFFVSFFVPPSSLTHAIPEVVLHCLIMVKLSVDLNEPKDSSKTDKAAQNGLDYGQRSLNVDVDVLKMAKYGKDYKIILVYVEHGSSNVDTSIFVTPKKGVAIAVELDDILGEYVHIGNQITRNESIGNENTGNHMVVHVGNSSTVDDVLELEMLFKTEGVGPVGKFKEVEVDADNELEKESDT